MQSDKGPDLTAIDTENEEEADALSGAFCERLATIALGEDYEDEVPKIEPYETAIATLRTGERLHLTPGQMLSVGRVLRQFAENGPAQVREYVRQSATPRFNMTAVPQRLELGATALDLASDFERAVQKKVLGPLEEAFTPPREEQEPPQEMKQLPQTTE